MATVGPITEWPFEYKGWKITYYVEAVENPQDRTFMPLWAETKIIHLHEDEQQLVRWTKKRKRVDLKKIKEWYMEGEEEQLCCFVCAVYMPDSVYEYFERCKEMVRCSLY